MQGDPRVQKSITSASVLVVCASLRLPQFSKKEAEVNGTVAIQYARSLVYDKAEDFL